MARLENAFRSVPTEHLIRSTEELGDYHLYSPRYSNYIAGQGHIGDIFCKCGVKQGCPHSPILFDLALKQLVRAVDDGKCGYNFDQWKVSILEYADNLCLVTESPWQLQALLEMANEYAGRAGLTFKPATLSLNKILCEDYSFHVGRRTTASSKMEGPLPLPWVRARCKPQGYSERIRGAIHLRSQEIV